MIERIIDWSLSNRFLVLLLALALAFGGVVALRDTPVDAIPDLSDVQVIVKTSYPGQAPRVVEDQVTYPLTTALMSVPGARAVRGYSFFGDSYVYVLFEDGTDLYWARSRVLEYLNQVSGRLPPDVQPVLGPDATGVGWVYEYALVDRSGAHDLAQLRSLQDWFLKFELQAVPGVAEVATVGGMVRQYQVVVDPSALRAYGLPLGRIRDAIQRGNREVGGSVIEMAEAEYMVRSTGYLQSVADLRSVPLGLNDNGTPIRLEDVAEVRLGPQMRRGIAELDGEGEVVGGIVVMRSGENALRTIDAVKQRLGELRSGLPEGVEIVETYDRSALIERAVSTLEEKLVEEIIVVVLVCFLFLFHFRSSLVIVVSLPLGILAAFGVMHLQGLNANIMSLGGIAIAIGAMVDAAIVMIETLHKKMEEPGYRPERHWKTVREASGEVGPALFFSLLIITLSFLPVFTLQAQEGRMFAPLAFTKTWAMAASAGLSVTLVPVLMGYLVRGRIRPERANSLNRGLAAAYRPVVTFLVRHPVLVCVLALVVMVSAAWPLSRLGSEFMPEMDEGDLMYMPTTYPGLSIGKAQELLQQTDKLIRTVPEVERVFGKIGRADTATDPAPLTMIETVIRLKPRSEWRPGVTAATIRHELDRVVDLPGLTNAWVWPIRTRIDMLSTGFKTPVGLKVAGPDLTVIERIGADIETILREVPGTASVFSERVQGGRYVTVDIDRVAASRYALNIDDVQDVVRTAIGGMNVTETVEGLERYPVNLRYPRTVRDSAERIRLLPIVTPDGQQIPLQAVADVRIEDGPPMIRSENARPNGWVYVDIDGRDLGRYVADARNAVERQLKLPPGYSVRWSGQYEYMERALERLRIVVPATLAVIVLLLYLNFRGAAEVLIILGSLPMALVGGFWLLWWLDYNLSIAAGVGFIALAGVAVETAVVMLVYLQQGVRLQRRQAASEGRALDAGDLEAAVVHGALRRLRPKVMTVTTIIAGLLPIMFSSGTGSEVMKRIAAPMVGGMVSATVLTLVVVPALFLLWQRWCLRRTG
ncbi:efflux RND transporter permease subunit [Elongatibacter sediminis]|uniref:CusA/CzcA family heavy metal efflux RND transporter n=1 Tax=Elongatibacter sediminis TaxID=3119006 RepID=A0AAW9RFP2_9GAMM